MRSPAGAPQGKNQGAGWLVGVKSQAPGLRPLLGTHSLSHENASSGRGTPHTGGARTVAPKAIWRPRARRQPAWEDVDTRPGTGS